MMFFTPDPLMMIFFGVVVGLGAGFSGLGGGFLVVPLLLVLGYEAQFAVGTSFLVILAISISSLFAHRKADNIDYTSGALLGAGGIVGAQAGARLVENVSTPQFKLFFAIFLVVFVGYLLRRKSNVHMNELASEASKPKDE
jgi:uncharacterized protein